MSKVQFTELDFFDNKQTIVDYIQSKTEFQDVNYLGSTINLLVDALAYATTVTATTSNFAMSETFLDSVLLRANALSRAKELGYDTATISAAIMRVKVTVSNQLAGDPDITLSRGQVFGTTYTFTNLDSVTLTKEQDELGAYVDETQRVATFDIYQGQLVSKTYTISGMADFEPFVLREPNIDARRIRVSVDGTDWTRYDGTVNISGDTEIYYVEESNDGNIHVKFGDDILGKKPVDGQEVVIEYLITDGIDGNDINTISYPLYSANPNYSIEVIEQSTGGANEQDVNRIANTAPRLHGSQKRAVIVNDYVALLQSHFSWIERINVWGGEDNVPPQYGKVFIAIKPYGADYLAPTLADAVKTEVLDTYAMLGITPEIIDPVYTYIDLVTEVFWQENQTNLASADILSTYVTPAITNFFTNNVSDFSQNLYYSKLVASIDDSYKAISHNDTELYIRKKFTPTPFVVTSVSVDMNNPLKSGTITSNVFQNITGDNLCIKDNSNGVLNLYKDNVLLTSGVGTVNYTTGLININYYMFEVANGTVIHFTGTPTELDIFSGNNNLLLIGDTTITMTKT